ncbi:TATA-box-binding protein-like isoform X2 [Scophthalmus maximus]|nr:TATA-box-binding protein-like isoform X2 [Scophthalmus maximus]
MSDEPEGPPPESGQEDTDETEQMTEDVGRSAVNCISLDCSSQNPTGAAEVSGTSSLQQLGDASVRSDAPGTSAIPLIRQQQIIPRIRNVNSSVKLGCRLDLNFIAHNTWNVEYKKSGQLIMRIRKPRTTAMIYSSGRVICSGARSEEESRTAARRFAYKLMKLGLPVSFLNFKIQNVMATCSSFPVSLERLTQAYPQHCSYDPELFSGLFFKGIPGMTVNVFANGEMAFLGAKSTAEIYSAIDTICPMLSCFRRQGGQTQCTLTSLKEIKHK